MMPLAPAAADPGRSAAAPVWSALTPEVAGAKITSLTAVTCITASDCWAVGDRFKQASSNSGPALIEHYSSQGWKPVAAAPAQKGTLDELSGVSCLSATNCWAVGVRSGSHPGNLIEHYGAHRDWRAVAPPSPQGALSAVSCQLFDGQCWAVGSSSEFRRVITFRLTGGVWRYVAPAPVPASFVQVTGVACATADNCLMVGLVTPLHGAGQALAERWNGHDWSRVAVAGELSGGGSLSAVACSPESSSKTCWAVGQTATNAPGLVPIHPLIEHWEGDSLIGVASPLGGLGDYPELEAVTCAGFNACQAVGSRGSGEDEAQILTEGWNGSRWSRETSSSPLYGFRTLSGVACPSAKDCWAVGEGLIRDGEGTRMIIEHLSEPS
jgi:hypothetical protein